MSYDADAQLYFIQAYAGSDAGWQARKEFLADIARLHAIEAAALEAVNIHLNDAGPAAFETMKALREALQHHTRAA